MTRKKRSWQRMIPAGAVTVSLFILLTVLYGGELLRWGQQTALLAAGMRSPEEMFSLLTGRTGQPSDNPSAKPSDKSPDIPARDPGSRPSDPIPDSSTRPSAAPSVPVEPPPEDGTGGKIAEQAIPAGARAAGAVSVLNRSNKDFDYPKELQIKPDLGLPTAGNGPLVLICHTHTTESYMPYDAGYYNDGDTPRTADPLLSVTGVGAELADQLRAAGIGTVHDTTVHDSPQYTGAYTRSEKTVAALLTKYPSIRVVLDIHRDGLMVNTTTKLKPTVLVDGQKAAQLMLICGVSDVKTIPHPDWQQNFRFALRLHDRMESRYPGLMRPLSLVSSRYNQHLAPGALLIEVGSEANTQEEAKYAVRLLAEELSGLLKELTIDS
ncbi:MAG: stage II sporulation protein P [Oscillospiraceae bacterium]|nr:stage II sporulation protein P [Oscillospiraceae bacterium]